MGDRPVRVSETDLNLIESGIKNIVFGTSTKDVVEIYAYDATGTIVSHINVAPDNEALILTSLADSEGNTAADILNINLVKIFENTDITPGRYNISANFFRNEVGSEEGVKLFIADISPSRTEIVLKSADFNPEVVNELHEFVTPSIPKSFAQELITTAIEMTSNIEDLVISNLDNNVVLQLSNANLIDSLKSSISIVLPIIQEIFLDLLVENITFGELIQQDELNHLLSNSIVDGILELNRLNQLDRRLETI